MAGFPSVGPRAVKPRGPDRRFNGRFSSPYVRAVGLPWSERRKTSGRRAQEREGRDSRPATDRGETLFLSAFEDAPEALAILDRQGTLLLVNRQCERLFGYRRENLFGHTIGMLVPEHCRTEALGWEETAIPPEGALRLTLAGRRLDGSEFPLEMALSQLHGSRHPLLLAQVRDITVCSQALAALQEQNALLSAANIRLHSEVEFCERTIAELNQLAGRLRHAERE